MTIYNLGGPGSGKITHCEQITREKTSFVHISMADIMTTMLKGTGECQCQAMTSTPLLRSEGQPRDPHQADDRHPPGLHQEQTQG